MTKLVRCRQGHVFDLDQNTACPQCGEIFATDDDTASKKDVPLPKPAPVPSNGLLQHLLTFPLNAVIGAVLVVLACSVWYLTSRSPSPVPPPPVSVAVTKPPAPSEQAKPPASDGSVRCERNQGYNPAVRSRPYSGPSTAARSGWEPIATYSEGSRCPANTTTHRATLGRA